jgi:glucosamine kinase
VGDGETANEALYFCVDGGGTRSRGRLFDREGRTLADAEDGACNPTTNFDLALASISGLWRQCCTSVGRSPHDFAGVAFSAGSAGTFLEVGAKFLAALPGFSRSYLMSDGYAALIGAGCGAPSSLIIIGTGVAGHRLFANGLSIQRDAWGWVAGDRGSGSWIGQKAVRHCFAALDGVVARDALSEAVWSAFGGAQAIRAGALRDLGPRRFASFAPLVLEHADAGDAMAVRIRDRAVEHLAATIGVIASPDAPFYAAGGLVAPLRPWLSSRLAFPILDPQGDALTGCFLVATGRAPAERALLFGETVEPSP